MLLSVLQWLEVLLVHSRRTLLINGKVLLNGIVGVSQSWLGRKLGKFRSDAIRTQKSIGILQPNTVGNTLNVKKAEACGAHQIRHLIALSRTVSTARLSGGTGQDAPISHVSFFILQIRTLSSSISGVLVQQTLPTDLVIKVTVVSIAKLLALIGWRKQVRL